MNKSIRCKNTSCLYHSTFQRSNWIKRGKVNNQQIWQCKSCNKRIRYSETIKTRKFHNPELIKMFCMMYANNGSLSRLSKILKVSKSTLLKMLEFAGEEIKKHHEEKMKGKVFTAIAFDEMETFVHSKALPVSIGMAVDTETREIIRVDFAEFPMKGAIGKKLRKAMTSGKLRLSAKYTARPNNKPAMRDRIFKLLKNHNTQHGTDIITDQAMAYGLLCRTLLPHCNHYQTSKTSKTKASKYAQESLNSLNSVCASFRTYSARLSRRTFITSKTIKNLQHAVYILIAFHNGYDLKEIFNK